MIRTVQSRSCSYRSNHTLISLGQLTACRNTRIHTTVYQSTHFARLQSRDNTVHVYLLQQYRLPSITVFSSSPIHLNHALPPYAHIQSPFSSALSQNSTFLTIASSTLTFLSDPVSRNGVLFHLTQRSSSLEPTSFLSSVIANPALAFLF